MNNHDPFEVAREWEKRNPGRKAIVGHWSDAPPGWFAGRDAEIVARCRVHPHDPDVRIWAAVEEPTDNS